MRRSIADASGMTSRSTTVAALADFDRFVLVAPRLPVDRAVVLFIIVLLPERFLLGRAAAFVALGFFSAAAAFAA